MDVLNEIIDNEFSTAIIEKLDQKYTSIGKLVSGHMEDEEYQKIIDEFHTLLGDSSKDYFVQGFLRGIAAATSGVL